MVHLSRGKESPANYSLVCKASAWEVLHVIYTHISLTKARHMVMPNYTGEGSTSLTMGPGELKIFVDSTKKYSFRFLLLDILLKR